MDQLYMEKALMEAAKAEKHGEVPIGAVIVKGDKIIARGHNTREAKKNALCHAEIIAINKACKKLKSWRLSDCDLYVTLEPCPMCMGAIINSRIKRIVFGAYDRKAGSCGSVINLNDYPYNHHPQITGGVLEDRCSTILSSFFTALRNKKRKTK